jgi:protein tyrosine/serine phosphatase
MVGTRLGNAYRVSPDVYRSRQPGQDAIPDLQAMGIHSVLNLRSADPDGKAFAAAGLSLFALRTSAWTLTESELVTALRQIRAAPKPVLVHCWHGSDRTGAVIAAYRIVFQEWTPAAAADEMRHGGFGFHESRFPNLVRLVEGLDAAELRRQVLAQ